MIPAPTYTAHEIHKMCCTMALEGDTFKILCDLVEEEMDCYTNDELLFINDGLFRLFLRRLILTMIK